jgi:diketogulonate reductase-like aldo/keto reductase
LSLRRLELRDGRTIPVIGQGTWEMGVRPAQRDAEVAALRLGLDLGMRVIDTAEMYGDGGAEEVVAQAIEGRRDEVYVVTKVLPQNASRKGTVRACEKSLARLRTDRIDLYLLHWESGHPLADTVEAFQELAEDGKILSWGVSNFDDALLAKLRAVPQGGECAANQALYNLNHRGPEWSLLNECTRNGLLFMAYSPLDEGRLEIGAGPSNPRRRALQKVAERHGATPAQIAIAFTIARPGIVSIPKASDPDHVRQNADAARIALDDDDRRELDAVFPPPRRAAPLDMI